MTTEELPTIKDHSIHLVFPFTFSINPKDQAIVDKQYIETKDHFRLESLLNILPYSTRQKNLLLKKKNDAVWQKSTLALDLHLDSVVKNTLDDNFYFKKKVPHGYPSLVLSQSTLDILNHEKGGKTQGLDIKLSNSATKRLSNNDVSSENLPWINFIINEVRLFMLGTGVGGISIKISLKNIHSIHYLLETLYQISRNNINNKKARSIRWHSSPDNEADTPNTNHNEVFSFIDIINAILPLLREPLTKKQPSIFEINSTFWDKTFCYTAIKLNRPFNTDSQKEDFITKISKKFTDDYLPSNSIIAPSIYKPFDYISHAVSVEGGAIAIEPNNSSKHEIPALDTFIKNSVKNCYYPIALMAYFEYIALLKLSSNGMKKINFHHPCASDLDHMNTFKSNVYNFRLNYRFSHISNITMHNTIYNKWRDSFLLKDILEDISNDASDVTDFVDSIRKNKIDNELKVIEKIVIYFGGLALIKEMTDFNIYETLLANDFFQKTEIAQTYAPISLVAILSLFVIYRIVSKK